MGLLKPTALALTEQSGGGEESACALVIMKETDSKTLGTCIKIWSPLSLILILFISPLPPPLKRCFCLTDARLLFRLLVRLQKREYSLQHLSYTTNTLSNTHRSKVQVEKALGWKSQAVMGVSSLLLPSCVILGLFCASGSSPEKCGSRKKPQPTKMLSCRSKIKKKMNASS